MKRLFTVYTFILIGTSFMLCQAYYPEDEASIQKLALQWRQDYQRVYRSKNEAEKRYDIFRTNVKKINQLNEKFHGQTEFILNQFADLTQEEFNTRILMPKRRWPKYESHRYIRRSPGIKLPESFDWSQKGTVTAVKDQGDAGSCWAFSAVGNIEGQWNLSGNPLTNFSVEQVVECDGMQDPKQGKADCGIFGGWPYLAYQYVMKAGGLETWDDFRYCSGGGGRPGTCDPCPAAGYNWTLCGPPVPYCNMTQSCGKDIDTSKFVPGLKVIDWKAIDTNETIIAEQLMKIGPFSVALDAQLLPFYHKGVFNPGFLCSKTYLDHAVLMVGFGVEKGWFSTKPYWKIKNSWGPSWGENGYFRIYRGAGTCGINTQFYHPNYIKRNDSRRADVSYCQKGRCTLLSEGQMSVTVKVGQMPVTVKEGQMSVTVKEGQMSVTVKEGQISAMTREGQMSAMTQEGQMSGMTQEGQMSVVVRRADVSYCQMGRCQLLSKNVH